jgi:hypothetical protein
MVGSFCSSFGRARAMRSEYLVYVPTGLAGRWAWRRRPLLVLIDTLGHAWSGGDPAYAYHDSAGPEATALLGKFIGENAQIVPESPPP